MEQNKDKEFDLYIRSMMENAEEEVPAGAWEKCAGALDKASRKPFVLRWPVFLVPVAAAAAVAAVLFVGTGRSSNGPELVAEVGQPEIVTESPARDFAGTEEFVPDAIPSAAPSAKPAGGHAAPVVSLAETVSDSDAILEPDAASQEVLSAGESVSPVAPAVSDVPAVSAADDAAEPSPAADDVTASSDPFAVMEWEDSGKKSRKIDLSLGGELFSNGRPSPVTGGVRRVAGGSVKTVTQTSNNSTYAVPVSLGINARYSFTDRWAVGAGVQWSMLERTFRGYYENEPTSTDIHNTLHYIGIPLNVYFNILNGRHVSLYAFAGGVAEKGIVSNFRIPTSNGIVNYKEGIGGFQFSLAGGFGIQFNFSPLVSIYLDPSIRYYFDCSQPTSIRTQQPLMMGFEAGLRFNL